MAKKGRKKKTGTRRHKRVGAMSLTASNPIVKFAPIAIGYFFADKINPQIDKLTGGKVIGKVVGAIQGGLGAALVFGGKKVPGGGTVPGTLIGGLLLGAGAKRLMAEFGIGYLGGYGSVPVIGRTMAGYGSVPVIGSGMPRRKGMNGGIGSYSTYGQLGEFRVPNNSRVMRGFNGGSGSGLMNSGSVMQ